MSSNTAPKTASRPTSALHCLAQHVRDPGRILVLCIPGRRTRNAPQHVLRLDSNSAKRLCRDARHLAPVSLQLVSLSVQSGCSRNVPCSPTLHRMRRPHRPIKVELLRRRGHDIEDGVIARRRKERDNSFAIHLKVQLLQLRCQGSLRCTVRPVSRKPKRALLWVSEETRHRSPMSLSSFVLRQRTRSRCLPHSGSQSHPRRHLELVISPPCIPSCRDNDPFCSGSASSCRQHHTALLLWVLTPDSVRLQRLHVPENFRSPPSAAALLSQLLSSHVLLFGCSTRFPQVEGHTATALQHTSWLSRHRTPLARAHRQQILLLPASLWPLALHAHAPVPLIPVLLGPRCLAPSGMT